MQKALLTFCILLALFISNAYAQKADPGEIELLLDRHNFWRKDVGLGKIQYSDAMADVAYQWAKQLKRQGCAFKHSQGDYGENLFKGTIGYYTIGDAVDAWGEEKEDYNYARNKCKRGKMCGHYTQIVWKTTTHVGCAKVECGGDVIWVCNYDPPGNWVGQKPY